MPTPTSRTMAAGIRHHPGTPTSAATPQIDSAAPNHSRSESARRRQARNSHQAGGRDRGSCVTASSCPGGRAPTCDLVGLPSSARRLRARRVPGSASRTRFLVLTVRWEVPRLVGGSRMVLMRVPVRRQTVAEVDPVYHVRMGRDEEAPPGRRTGWKAVLNGVLGEPGRHTVTLPIMRRSIGSGFDESTCKEAGRLGAAHHDERHSDDCRDSSGLDACPVPIGTRGPQSTYGDHDRAVRDKHTQPVLHQGPGGIMVLDVRELVRDHTRLLINWCQRQARRQSHCRRDARERHGPRLVPHHQPHPRDTCPIPNRLG